MNTKDTVRKRIFMIRMMEKMEKYPELSKKLGLEKEVMAESGEMHRQEKHHPRTI